MKTLLIVAGCLLATNALAQVPEDPTKRAELFQALQPLPDYSQMDVESSAVVDTVSKMRFVIRQRGEHIALLQRLLSAQLAKNNAKLPTPAAPPPPATPPSE